MLARRPWENIPSNLGYRYSVACWKRLRSVAGRVMTLIWSCWHCAFTSSTSSIDSFRSLFFLILLSLIDLSLLVKVLYRLLSGLDLLSIGLTTGEEAAQREGGGAGHGDQQEGQEVSQHLHGVAGVVTVAR